MMAEIFQLEQKLEASLIRLKEDFHLYAVKGEFEAEGASFRDLVRLRRLTARHNILLYLKIGGVEALRDIKDAFDLGVDGLVAPMVESPFGVIKFLQAVELVFSDRKIFKSINIETCNAVKCIDEILSAAKDKVDNITIGRTDLSNSYLNAEIQPDSKFIFDLIEELSSKVHSAGIALTIGGSISKNSVTKFKQSHRAWGKNISSIETRKVVLPVDQMLETKNALIEALMFEELYLSSKLDNEIWLSQADRDRLAKLKNRI
jgi:4-hydroxy-2-oxoheptanedioate aldolase